MTSQSETLHPNYSKEHKRMIEKANYFKDQITHLNDTISYYCGQIGKIEIGISQANIEKSELIRKVLELNANIESLKDQYKKEIDFTIFTNEEENK